MSRLNLIIVFGNEDADVFNKCSKAYELGRADAEAEHDKMCETCIHRVSTEDIEQIREDALDEFIDWLIREEI